MARSAKTLVIGVGEVGGALADVLERHEPVLRLDLPAVEISEPIDTMHICLPYRNQNQFHGITLDYIGRFRPRLTIINSTVVPGTTRALAQAARRPVAYSPVRGKHSRMVEDLLRYTKFVAAPEVATARAAQDHLSRAGFKTRRLQQTEGLELAKLAETTYFGLLIAFAQELSRYAAKVDAAYDEATALFEEVDFLPRWRYFPGFIGGHCVIPNIRLLTEIAPSTLLAAILESNERRAHELKDERAARTGDPKTGVDGD